MLALAGPALPTRYREEGGLALAGEAGGAAEVEAPAGAGVDRTGTLGGRSTNRNLCGGGRYVALLWILASMGRGRAQALVGSTFCLGVGTRTQGRRDSHAGRAGTNTWV